MLDKHKLLVLSWPSFPKFLPFSYGYFYTLVLENIGWLKKNSSGKKGGGRRGKDGC